jgi:methionyl-tRNA formyltransferase
VLERVALLAAHTARSQAYLQVLAMHGLLPGTILLLGPPGARPGRGQTRIGLRSWHGIALPDLEEPLEETCQRTGIAVLRSAAADVNAPETRRLLDRCRVDVVIYSGVPGQIVSAEVLASGPVFLHLHSGWLPEYRGSTTVYYALLDGEPPGVSALLLDPSIDTGPVLARKHYPWPSADMDVDRLYDAAIRADLLAQVMRVYRDTGRLPPREHQPQGADRTHFVIHPVLKHLALLSLDRTRD